MKELRKELRDTKSRDTYTNHKNHDTRARRGGCTRTGREGAAAGAEARGGGGTAGDAAAERRGAEKRG